MTAPSTPLANHHWSNKQAGVVHTPKPIVDFMLDQLLPEHLHGVRICEPACGDGAFLSEVVRRICSEARSSSNWRDYIGTLESVTGFDIDNDAIADCKRRLDQVCAEELGVDTSTLITWNIQELDMLDKISWQHYAESFDYVVGNPPYVRIQHLEDTRRKQILNSAWKTVSGCTDLYIIFFEIGLELLKSGGKLSYITANSWLKTVSGRGLRRELRSSYRLDSIIDFGHEQVFPSVTTYTAITRVSKLPSNRSLASAETGRIIDGCVSSTNGFSVDLRAPTWSITSKADRDFIRRKTKVGIRLGDIADINVGIQTLADRVFILTVESYLKDDRVLCWSDINGEHVLLERPLTRRILKASVMKNNTDPQERVIIYPYHQPSGQLLSESVLVKEFPLAYKWLDDNREYLLSRDKGKSDPNRWYGYGRDVSIRSGFGRKILTSGMNKMPNFQYSTDEEALFYSGYAIRPTVELDPSLLLEELNSKDMYRYTQLSSRPYRNGWYSYAKTFIQDYPVSRSLFT